MNKVKDRLRGSEFQGDRKLMEVEWHEADTIRIAVIHKRTRDCLRAARATYASVVRRSGSVLSIVNRNSIRLRVEREEWVC